MRSLRVRATWLATAVVLSSPAALADQYSWLGNDTCTKPCSGSWNDPKAWIPNAVPTAADTVTISSVDAISVTMGDATANVVTVSGAVSLDDGTLTLGGLAPTFSWLGGNISGKVVNPLDGVVTINGTVHLGGGTLKNDGVVNFVGTLLGDGSGVVQNSGIWNTGPLSSFGYQAGPNTADFYNTGTFHWLGGTTLTFGGACWGFHNDGELNVPAGTVVFPQSGNTHHTIGSGASFTGAGAVRYLEAVSAGTEVEMTGGSFTIAADTTVELGQGSTLLGNGTFAGPGTLTWSAGTLAVANDGDVFVVGPAATLAISGDGDKAINGGGTLDNQGNVVWSGQGNIGGSADGRVINAGTFTATSDASFAYGFNGGTNSSTFQNKGTFVKKTGTGATTLTDSWGLDNTGVLDVESGTLDLRGAGNEVHTLRTGGHIKGAGRVRALADMGKQDAALVLDGPTVVDAGATLELGAHSTLDGDGTLDGPGTILWTGASVSVDDMKSITFGKDSVVSIEGTVANTAGVGGSGKLTLSGKTTWASGDFELMNGTLTNDGTFTARSSGAFTINTSGAVFATSGTLVRDGNDDTTSLAVNFVNTGTVELKQGTLLFTNPVYYTYAQPSGTTRLSGGTLAGSPDADGKLPTFELAGGTLEGNGTVAANLTLDGSIVPGGAGKIGTITVQGDYVQAKSAELDLELGGTTAGTGFDQVSVKGNATIDGKMVVALASGYTPMVGDGYKVVVATGDMGMFAAVTPPSSVTLSTTYEAADVLLGVTAVTGTAGAGGAAGAGGSAGAAGAAGSGAAGAGAKAGAAGSGTAGSAGKGTAGSATAGAAGTNSTAGAAGSSGATPAGDDGGGGCAVTTSSGEKGGLTALLLGLAAVLGIRRRRAR